MYHPFPVPPILNTGIIWIRITYFITQCSLSFLSSAFCIKKAVAAFLVAMSLQCLCYVLAMSLLWWVGRILMSMSSCPPMSARMSSYVSQYVLQTLLVWSSSEQSSAHSSETKTSHKLLSRQRDTHKSNTLRALFSVKAEGHSQEWHSQSPLFYL